MDLFIKYGAIIIAWEVTAAIALVIRQIINIKNEFFDTFNRGFFFSFEMIVK